MPHHEPPSDKPIREVPAVIRKKGITHVTDNLPPGAAVVFSKAFVRIFRAEIENRIFVKKNKKNEE